MVDNQLTNGKYFCRQMAHIGKEIQKQAKRLKVGSTELAKAINTTKQNIHRIYKTKSIDTEQLMEISKFLKFDFFNVFSKELGSSFLEDTVFQRSEKQINSRAILYAGNQVVVFKTSGHSIGQLLHPEDTNYKDKAACILNHIDLVPQIYLRNEDKKAEYRKAVENGTEEQFRLAFFERILIQEIVDIQVLDLRLQEQGIINVN
jgi:DNA-binding Xre family transcriptional regulator